MKAIEVLSISKRYGNVAALDRVSFDVNPGESVALVGPNGAGKTTLLRILATLLKPTAGHARVLELDGRFRAAAIRRRIGYMPDLSVVMDDLNVREYLEFFAGVFGLRGKTAKERVDDLVGLLDLGPVIDRPSAALSRGMQQRLGLARTLIHNPDILLLDEPAANLDPRARVEMREVLKELQRMGKTILISSHILAELGELCDTLLLMQEGTIVHFGPIADLEKRLALRRRLAIRIDGDTAAFGESLSAESSVEQVEIEDGWLYVRLKADVEDTSFVLRRSMEMGAALRELREEKPGLEEAFMRLTQKGRDE